jgi:hypothetical protein
LVGGSSEGGAPDDALELFEFMRTLISGGSRAKMCWPLRKAVRRLRLMRGCSLRMNKWGQININLLSP